ncbi:hypothetical protein DENSPDRAFT_845877 [Dentipellis sp. KUC8613]|nr:hypothetical protein DENSPDRAFT_845877 [Dentipellis sp. KUC8613]
MAHFALDRAVFTAVFVECITYGICLIMSASTAAVFVYLRAQGGLADRRLFIVLIFMLVVVTIHVVTSYIWVANAFLQSDDVDGYLSNVSNPLFIIRNTALIFQTFLGDGVNIWRCYVVFNRKATMIVAPAVLMLGGIVCSLSGLAQFPHASPNVTVFNRPSRWIKAYVLLMMATNIYCTVAIILRIFTSGRGASLSNLYPVLVAIIETGSLYTASLLAYIVAFWLGSNVQYIIVAILTPLVPGIFCLLILQVRFHNAVSCDTSTDTYTLTELTHVSFSAVHHAFSLSRGTRGRRAVSCSASPSVAVQTLPENQEEEGCSDLGDVGSDEKGISHR